MTSRNQSVTGVKLLWNESTSFMSYRLNIICVFQSKLQIQWDLSFANPQFCHHFQIAATFWGSKRSFFTNFTLCFETRFHLRPKSREPRVIAKHTCHTTWHSSNLTSPTKICYCLYFICWWNSKVAHTIPKHNVMSTFTVLLSRLETVLVQTTSLHDIMVNGYSTFLQFFTLLMYRNFLRESSQNKIINFEGRKDKVPGVKAEGWLPNEWRVQSVETTGEEKAFKQIDDSMIG